MKDSDTTDWARRLHAHGNDAGITQDGKLVVYLNGRIWNVMGGDAARPSLLLAQNTVPSDVTWVDTTKRRP